jgi:hypothetical protein
LTAEAADIVGHEHCLVPGRLCGLGSSLATKSEDEA